MFSFFIENKFISQNQPGFKPGDSYINQHQLLMIHIRLGSKTCFLWYYKGFWQGMAQRFNIQIQCNEMSGNLLTIMNDFLSNQYQRVALNGQTSKWTPVNAGVPQGPILWSLLFLIYIYDLSIGISLKPRLFIDSTSVFSVVQNVHTSVNNFNDDLVKINKSEINGKWVSTRIPLSRPSHFFL